MQKVMLTLSGLADLDHCIPSDIIDIAGVLSAYGVRGQIKLKMYNPDSSILHSVNEWWIRCSDFSWKRVEPTAIKFSGQLAIVKLEGIDDREKAEFLKGAVIGISRSRFPELAKGEYYWVDLCFMDVFNLQNEYFGKIIEIFDSGANVIFRVSSEIDSPIEAKKKRLAPVNGDILIPFVDAYIASIDRLLCRVVVDWQRDY